MIKRFVCLSLAVLLLLGAVFAAYKMISMAHEYRSGKEVYADLQQQAEKKSDNAAITIVTNQAEESESNMLDDVNDEIVFPIIDFALLKEKNPDVVGWVYIEGTNINYPVVQGEDNRHYVSTMFDGSTNKAGSIFMDYQNNPDMSDRHTVLYGHNMKNKTMFADILNYKDQAYYDEHPVGVYITPEKNYRFDIVAAHVVSLADSAWQLEFVTEDEIESWLREAMICSGFESRVQFQPGDKLITLSTCSYEFDDARFVLVGILKEL